MRVRCNNCCRNLNRSPSALSRISNVFCSRECKRRFEELKYQAQKEADEKNMLSRDLIRDIERFNETYGG